MGVNPQELGQLRPSHVSLRIPLLLTLSVATLGIEIAVSRSSWSYVPLMAGQSARALQGSFNTVPVLHSNQPETVSGTGILVDTSPGSAVSTDSGQRLKNATFTFEGKFGIHIHHKYFPTDKEKLGGSKSRGTLTLATIATNTADTPVTIKFHRGSVKNSFEAPYHTNKLMGVKPLGHRPWNTGPGDATSIQMLRGRLDRNIVESVVIEPRSQKVIFTTIIPSRGIANGLLSGESNGPFQLAVVAAEEKSSELDLITILKSGFLAPGRIYLSRIREIQSGKVFSRVAGVAIGDHYKASLNHNLKKSALHVPLTSTSKHHFGTHEIQVNPLKTRMLDSAVNNVGTYGVRFDVTLNLKGSGAHELVLSHPVATGLKQPFTAFRGSIGIKINEVYKEVHVGLRSGQSLALSELNLSPNKYTPVTISLVYPADNTPGHLLSVVPVQQLAMINHQMQTKNQPSNIYNKAEKPNNKNLQQTTQISTVNRSTNKSHSITNNSYIQTTSDNNKHPEAPPLPPKIVSAPLYFSKTNRLNIQPSAMILPQLINSSLGKHYQDAIKAQQQWFRQLQSR